MKREKRVIMFSVLWNYAKKTCPWSYAKQWREGALHQWDYKMELGHSTSWNGGTSLFAKLVERGAPPHSESRSTNLQAAPHWRSRYSRRLEKALLHLVCRNPRGLVTSAPFPDVNNDKPREAALSKNTTSQDRYLLLLSFYLDPYWIKKLQENYKTKLQDL